LATSNNSTRINFASGKNQFDYPDFLEIQLKSFREFFQLETTPENRESEGLFKVFAENFPITDTRNQFVLEFWITSLIHHDILFQNVLKEV
jgi:DNA-directed RNA polymerase subunit beta